MKVHGYNLAFCGPRDELDPLAALKTIQAKIISQGCELVAIIEWGMGGPILGDANSWWQSGGKGWGDGEKVFNETLSALKAVTVLRPSWFSPETSTLRRRPPECRAFSRLEPHCEGHLHSSASLRSSEHWPAMAFLPCHLLRAYTSKTVRSHATAPWSRWTLVRASCSHRPVVERKPVVLRASTFQHLFEVGPTEKIYTNTPVSGLGQTQQGKMLQEWARKVLQEKNPKAEVLDAERGTRRDGRRRGSNMTSCDFLLDGRKVEVKSAKMAWSSAGGRWYVQFFGVKLAYGERARPAFDDLYLVIMSPKGLRLIKHDLVTGVSTRGKATAVGGHLICVYGRTGTDCWEHALNKILEKLCEQGGCSVVAEQPLSKLDFQMNWSNRASPGQAAVAGLPMSDMSKAKRGNRIQEIGLAIDRRLHPQTHFHLMEGNSGKANAPADWVRGRVRVELKSCGLTFNRAKGLWQCNFYCIKPGLFDELWLAIYSVTGLHFYTAKSLELLQLSSAGAATRHNGYTKVFYGPRQELDPLEALKTIQAKMISRGCELVAIVEWDNSSSAPHANLTSLSVEKGAGAAACSRTNANLQISSKAHGS